MSSLFLRFLFFYLDKKAIQLSQEKLIESSGMSKICWYYAVSFVSRKKFDQCLAGNDT